MLREKNRDFPEEFQRNWRQHPCLSWPGKMSITSWKKGLQSVLTSTWMHNAAQDRDSKKKRNTTKHCGNQMWKFIINLYKVKEHVSMSSSVTRMRDLWTLNAMYWRKEGIWYLLLHVQRQSMDCWLSTGEAWEWIRVSDWERRSFPEPALSYSLEGCSVALVLLEHHLGLVK